jgi:hypothetical protein
MASLRTTTLALLFGVLALATVGCTGDLTEIVVVVDSDMAVPAELTSVTIHVDGLSDVKDVVTTFTNLDTSPTLPIWLGLVNDGDRVGPITVRVTGTGGVTAERSEVYFQHGKTLMLRIDLSRACKTNPSACARACKVADSDCLTPWTGPPMMDAAGLDASDNDASGADAGDDATIGDAADDAAGDAMVDAGPIDPCTVATCFNYVPSNFARAPFDSVTSRLTALGAALTSNGALNVSCADAVFDSTTLMYMGTCSKALVAVEITQSNGVPAVVIPVTALVIGPNGVLRVVGDRPVIFAVFGDVRIDGRLDASAVGEVPGAGGNVSCTVGTGQPGVSQASGTNGGGSGGGGGAFGSVGGGGGAGDVNGSTLPPVVGVAGPLAAAGAIEGDVSLIPLRGGCAGGAGGQRDVTGLTYGGAGGGAVQVSAAGTLSVNGVVAAGGGGGQKALALKDGGGAGGSGGAVLLEGNFANLSAMAWITANGGGGGGGYDYDSVDWNPGAGADAPPDMAVGGFGGAGDNLGGKGGNGAALNLAAQGGRNAAHGTPFNGAFGAGGGGGGGGVGRIRVRHTPSAGGCPLTGNFSPAPTASCGT